MLRQLLNTIRVWILVRLGAVDLATLDVERTMFEQWSELFREAVADACWKQVYDLGLNKVYEGSNLGRNILRDEACEWTKLYLKDAGAEYSDSDVHLACELYYRLFIKGKVGK